MTTTRKVKMDATARSMEMQIIPHPWAGKTVVVFGQAAYGRGQSECHLPGEPEIIAYVSDTDLEPVVEVSRVLVSRNVSGLIAELSDGTYRRVTDDLKITEHTLDAGWCKRGLTALAADGFPSIEPAMAVNPKWLKFV